MIIEIVLGTQEMAVRWSCMISSVLRMRYSIVRLFHLSDGL